ncbi:hypothetical protein DY000_02042931 [Brassica cretica]|uniref:Uncharacterized protein n=1 Tax=Brassica cretica TaxID=69181 RepID=A0ABQ7BEI3_BRACR|nr:hypothetical protein DY000_02042931 [Brassica cretica]
MFIHQLSNQKSTKEFYDTAGGIENSFNQQSRHTTHPSINTDVPTIARRSEFSRRAYDLYDGRTIPVHTKDIKRLLERASRDEPVYICLPEHASSFTQTKLVPEIYTKDEINEIFCGVCGEHDRNKEAFQMKLDGVYYPLNDKGIYRALETREERLDGRCDDIYFTMDLTISALTSKVEAIQGELVEIQSYIARRPEASISIDRRNNKSIDTNNPTSIDSDTNRGRLVPKTTSDTSNTPYHEKEISADTYATLTRHQFNLESLGQRLQMIENTTAAM